MSIISDIIRGSSLRETESGLEAVRMFAVSGLTGGPAAILNEARTHLGVPRRGDPHPSIAELLADTIHVTPLDQEQAQVLVTYKALSAGDVEGGADSIDLSAGLSQEQTHRDAYGKLIGRDYEVQDLDESGNPIPGGHRIVTHAPPIDVQRPYVTYSQRVTLGYSPATLALLYVGTVGGWQNTIGGSYLCTGINATSADGGATWNTSFEFALDPDGGTWQAVVEEIDPKTGKVVPGGSVAKFDVYPSASFDALPVKGPT